MNNNLRWKWFFVWMAFFLVEMIFSSFIGLFTFTAMKWNWNDRMTYFPFLFTICDILVLSLFSFRFYKNLNVFVHQEDITDVWLLIAIVLEIGTSGSFFAIIEAFTSPVAEPLVLFLIVFHGLILFLTFFYGISRCCCSCFWNRRPDLATIQGYTSIFIHHPSEEF